MNHPHVSKSWHLRPLGVHRTHFRLKIGIQLRHDPVGHKLDMEYALNHPHVSKSWHLRPLGVHQTHFRLEIGIQLRHDPVGHKLDMQYSTAPSTCV
jgi:hypothetical protein